MVLPCLPRHVRVGEARLVGQELDDRDVALAVLLEARQVLGDPVGETEGAAFHQEPDRARGDHLGVGVEEPEGVVAGGDSLGVEPRIAEGLDEGERAAPGHGDLGAGITAFGQVARDDLAEPIESVRIESERRGSAWRQWKTHRVLRGSAVHGSGAEKPAEKSRRAARACQCAVRRLCYTASVRDDAAPLAGLVILDLTRVLAGPYCTRLLADLGARVIKIERPGAGDEMRRGPIQLEEGRDDQSTYFVRCNAGKESVGLDLGHVAAQGVPLQLR